MPIKGSCLCGSIKLEVDPPYRRTTHCHCGMCRKAHGSAFASYLAVRQDSLRIVEGDSLVTSYRSSQNVRRRCLFQTTARLTFT